MVHSSLVVIQATLKEYFIVVLGVRVYVPEVATCFDVRHMHVV